MVKDWFCNTCKMIFSVMLAIIRLFFLLLALTFSGLQIILFTRTEICNIEMKGQPWRCDREKMMDNVAFVDKMYLENPELFEGTETQDLGEDEGDGGDVE